MNRKATIYIVLVVVVLGLLILIDSTRPKFINWKPTYAVKDKIPLGLYVLEKESGTLFRNQDIEKFSITPYEYFEGVYDYENEKYDAKGTFLNIDEINNIDEESAKELLYFASHGNTVFLSMKDFPLVLLDTLNIELANAFYPRDSIAFSLENKAAGKKKYYFNEGIGLNYFESIDTLSTTVLGYQEKDTLKHTNFIKVPFGQGAFLLHTQPAVFSNFHLLKGNHYEYTEKLLSHIPEGNIYWQARRFENNNLSVSPLRYIIGSPGLRQAWYLGLIGILIFIIFNAKRKQRIIPEIPPVKNTTVDFTKTIGNLYYQEKNHHTIIEKKIIYFLEHIRNEYMIDTYSLDDEFTEKLHHKTGRPIEDIEKVVMLIKKYRHQFQSTDADLIEINKAIEKLRL